MKVSKPIDWRAGREGIGGFSVGIHTNGRQQQAAAVASQVDVLSPSILGHCAIGRSNRGDRIGVGAEYLWLVLDDTTHEG